MTQEERQKHAELVKIRKLEEEIAYQKIELAKSLIEHYESELRQGKLPDCVYDDVFNIYSDARTMFKNFGYDQKDFPLSTKINYYLEKQTKEKEIKRILQEEKRKRLLEILNQKDGLQIIADKAYQMLEEGTKFLENKEFNKANERYLDARDLFEEIKLFQEVSRINNELLFNLKQEQKRIKKLKINEEKITLMRFEEMREQGLEEKINEKKATLLRLEEIRRQELEKIVKREERRELKKVTIAKIVDNLLLEQLNHTNDVIDNQKYNEGIMQPKEIVESIKNSKESLMTNEGEELEKVEKILRVSKCVRISQIKNVLNLSDEDFNEKIIYWVDHFGFKIEGEYVKFHQNSVESFIDMLDDQFKRWEQNIDLGSLKAENYKSCRSDLEISGLHKTNRINNELLFNLKSEKNESESLKQKDKRTNFMNKKVKMQ